MRSRTFQRAVVLLVVVAALQGGASAMADEHKPSGKSAPTNPLQPFAQGASAFVSMAAPFVNAASDTVFPRS
ncbi:hypothetical protein ACFQ0X_08435 [Streptomyces rectiviolaceus]|uniref:Secreted protein n=1 Tax=Streptomyces rectiviolaceus TaxID=332591 RepID=A0ABP6MFX3_9ACTN